VREQLREPALDIVERAHSAGELRADFDAKDVLIALPMISALPGTPTITAEDAHRHVDVILRGLGPG
jgi:hypothetical protein